MYICIYVFLLLQTITFHLSPQHYTIWLFNRGCDYLMIS
jgi:hypothetical protein